MTAGVREVPWGHVGGRRGVGCGRGAQHVTADDDEARAAIAVRDLEKRYGSRRVLRRITFDVPRGGMLVVTGPNGSGKTTLLRILVGLAAPTRGEVVVDGDRRQIGFLGHEPLLYRDLTALENLDLYGRLYRVAERRERAGMLLERFGLWECADTSVSPRTPAA